jgi:hypothetical protein
MLVDIALTVDRGAVTAFGLHVRNGPGLDPRVIRVTVAIRCFSRSGQAGSGMVVSYIELEFPYRAPHDEMISIAGTSNPLLVNFAYSDELGHIRVASPHPPLHPGRALLPPCDYAERDHY